MPSNGVRPDRPSSQRAGGRTSEGSRWAVVTGASTGIGLELARCAAADGWNVVLVARTAGRLEKVAAGLRQDHRVRAVPLAMDLTGKGAAERLFAATEEQRIEVDFLVNNAGFGMSRPFEAVPLRIQRAMVALNIGAVADLCRLYLPGMLARGRGRVLNVGSAAGYVPGLGFTLYAATKAFVLHLSEGLAAECRGTGVTVSVLCPGPVDTPFLDSAGIPPIRGVRRLALADAAKVAEAGYRGALAGRAVINPGVLPRLVPVFTRLSPRAAVRRIGFLVGIRGLRGPSR